MKTTNESYQNQTKKQTQNKIDNLQTQINKLLRTRKRNMLFFDYSSFLYRTIEKITPNKHFENMEKRIQRNDTLQRVHTLLINEHSRLIKVA